MTTTTSNLPTLPTLSSLLDDVASAIARDGIERHEHDVARVASAFGAAGRAGPVLDLVLDRSQPAVARERAFGRLTPDLRAVGARSIAA